MSDAEVEALARAGEIERAANLAKARGAWKRASQLFASLGRPAEGVISAVQGGEWRLAMEVALESGDEQVIAALAEELGKDPARAAAAAAQARLARRDDVAGLVLEPTAPAEAARCWYERGDHLRAARCWDRAGDAQQAMRAFEQHLAQSPDDAAAATRLAELRAAHGDDAGAVRALQSAVRAGGGDDAMTKLVCGLARLGYEHGAREWIRRLRDRDARHPADPKDYADALPRSAGGEKRYAGRYRVVREAGSGATGRVLEAVDELTGDTVALKVLAVSDDRSAAFARFMREAELARELDDPTLVRMRALDPEGPTIVYDWMPGGTLAERVGRIPLREARVVTLRVLSALEVLHRNGVVHRDVKPSNILFDPAGLARLGDLGAAHLGDMGATVTGGLVGSLPYMAPEQITGAAVAASTDLYALGCVLYQMLTGTLPYGGPDFVSEHLGAPVPRPSRARAGLPEAFDAVIAALLAKDPDARPPDVSSARALLAGLSWEDPEAMAAARVSIAPSLPAAAADDDGRLVPSTVREGAWTDVRLARDVVRVRVPSAARPLVERWMNAEHTALQPVYELLDEGEHLELRVEPADPAVAARELPEPARGRVLAALAAAGLDPARAASLPVAWDGDEAMALVSVALRAQGVDAETL